LPQELGTTNEFDAAGVSIQTGAELSIISESNPLSTAYELSGGMLAAPGRDGIRQQYWLDIEIYFRIGILKLQIIFIFQIQAQTGGIPLYFRS
jgi:hypothetical protein